jgi:hypothetical protein
MLSKSHPIILFIDRFGFSVYQDTLTTIPKFNFTSDLVSNLDVVSKVQFVDLVSTFIQINKIVPSSLAVILSDDVIYIKDLASPAQKPTSIPGSAPPPKAEVNEDKEHKDEVESFLENIPFEEILARVIRTGNINRIVAVNRDLVMTIIDAFAAKGSTIDTITPSFMYGQNVNFTKGLTSDNLRAILGSIEILRVGNLLTDQEKMIFSQDLRSEMESPSVSLEKKKQNRTQYILAGVFVILLIVLGVVYFVSQKTDEVSDTKNINRIINQKNVAPTVMPTVIPAPASASATIAPEDLKTVNIKISHDAQASAVATKLKTGFSDMGFENVTDEISKVSIPEKSSVIFSQNISIDLRSSVVAEIKEILQVDVSILESQDADSVINISIGKS